MDLTLYFYETISEYQRGFKPGYSCVNQLLAITDEIFSGFHDNYEVRGVFLDISKAFMILNATGSQEIY